MKIHKMHPQKITVLCGFHVGGVIGSYLFDVAENAMRVNCERCREIVNKSTAECGFKRNKAPLNSAMRWLSLTAKKSAIITGSSI